MDGAGDRSGIRYYTIIVRRHYAKEGKSEIIIIRCRGVGARVEWRRGSYHSFIRVRDGVGAVVNWELRMPMMCTRNQIC